MTSGDEDVGRVTVRISATSDRIRVVAQDRNDVLVDGDAAVQADGSCTTVDSIGGRVVVWVPEGTDLVLGTTSARVTVEGPVGRVAVVTDSGRINVADATSADIRTNSARVEVGRTSADCCVRTSSGRVRIRACGSADVTTKSGRIVVEAASGPVRAHCVSGRVEVGLETPEDVDAETVTGQIRVTVPHGVAIHTNDDLSVLASWPDGTASTVNGPHGEWPRRRFSEMKNVDPPVVVGSVLFTDLVGFTEFTDAVGDVEALRLLDQQRSLVDGHLDGRDDVRLVKEIGDGLMIWIGAAGEGLSIATGFLCTMAATHAAGTFPLTVRMGMHHGDSIVRGDDLVGQTVNIASRISELAGPGELLVSDEVLTSCPSVPVRTDLRPIGPVRVRGVAQPVWLHRFAAP